MRVQTLTFVFSDLETGRCLGHGLICPDTRYASIAWQGVDRLERRSPSQADWKLLDLALRQGLQPTPLERSHVAARILLSVERTGMVVQYLAGFPIDVAPSRAAEEFDAQLGSMAGAEGPKAVLVACRP